MNSSTVAASSHFPFLSSEGIKAYRKAIAAPEVLKNCASSPFKNTLVLRNVPKYSKFIRDLWTHPTTLKMIAEVAGVSLVPVINTEIGHTNIQANGSTVEEMIQELAVEPLPKACRMTEEQERFDPLASQSIQPWQ